MKLNKSILTNTVIFNIINRLLFIYATTNPGGEVGMQMYFGFPHQRLVKWWIVDWVGFVIPPIYPSIHDNCRDVIGFNQTPKRKVIFGKIELHPDSCMGSFHTKEEFQIPPSALAFLLPYGDFNK